MLYILVGRASTIPDKLLPITKHKTTPNETNYNLHISILLAGNKEGTQPINIQHVDGKNQLQ